MSPEVLKQLRLWFKKNAAILPWRPFDLNLLRDPYAVWISETMLQQTQVATVKDYFIRWMDHFKNVEILANANEEEVFKYWQGLGYYSRAKNILKTSKIITEIYKGKFPDNRILLEKLPGIGSYTAGAILSLAFHKKEALLDGNLIRIFSRFYGLNFLPTDKTFENNAKQIYWNYAKNVADDFAYLNNEALMELGRTICKIKKAGCDNCPLKSECIAYLQNKVAEFPPKKKLIPKNWHGTMLVIQSADNKILSLKGNQKFLSNQFALPHFESKKQVPKSQIPLEAENFVQTNQIDFTKECGTFNHSITIHKIECDVLFIKLKIIAQNLDTSYFKTNEIHWVNNSEALTFFANSFSLKALKLIP